jgi:ABC-2 type transport system permease protein
MSGVSWGGARSVPPAAPAPLAAPAPQASPDPSVRPASPASPAPSAGQARVTAARVLAAEWTKLASVGSTLWIAVATVVGAAGLAYGLGMFADPGDAAVGASLAVTGALLAQIGSLVLGALVGAGEYATGAYRTTYTAVPRRWPVLGAQVLVTAAWAVVTALVALVASLLVTTGQRSGLGVDLADDQTLRLLAGFVLHQTGVALLGLALGALVRRTTAGFMTGVMLVFVLDQFLAANPGRVADTLRALLPGAGGRLVQDDARLTALDAGSLGPALGTWGGGLVLALWVVALLGVALHRLRRHDLS